MGIYDNTLDKEAMHLEALDYEDWLASRRELQLEALNDRLQALQWTKRKYPHLKGTQFLISMVRRRIEELQLHTCS